MHADQYNPAQQAVVSLLGAPKGDRPTFDAGLRGELRSLLEERLEPLVDTIESDRFDDDILYLSKYMLTQALGCERKFMAELAEAVPMVHPPPRGGTVTPQGHRAVGALAGRGITAGAGSTRPWPRLQNADKSIADYLERCDETERAEMRAEAGAANDPVPGVLPPAQDQVEGPRRTVRSGQSCTAV